MCLLPSYLLSFNALCEQLVGVENDNSREAAVDASSPPHGHSQQLRTHFGAGVISSAETKENHY